MRITHFYLPSYTGDFRLIEVDGSSCKLEIVDPVAHELPILGSFLGLAVKEKWTDVEKVGDVDADGKLRQEIVLAASVATAGRALYGFVRPSDRTITAVKSEGGKIQVFEKIEEALGPAALTPDAIIPPKAEAKPEEKKPEETAKAVSVKRPTPSCPQCVLGKITRAGEVLRTFLTPDELRTWDREHFITVEGGLSHHRYMLAHRHSAYAAKCGRICFDLDDDMVVHFHDNSVPPEEEVLAAKLILEHREPWLRNEATTFHRSDVLKFKNPFGGLMDGVDAAIETQAIGDNLKRLFG